MYRIAAGLFALFFFPFVLSAQSFPRQGFDINASVGKSAETGLGAEASSSLYAFSRLRFNPTVFYGWVSGVKTHGGTASASQFGAALGGEVPLAAWGRSELDLEGDAGFLSSRFDYSVLVQGERVSGVQFEQGPFLSAGAKFKYHLTSHWSLFTGAHCIVYGDQTQDALGRWQITFVGISRHFNFDLFKHFRK